MSTPSLAYSLQFPFNGTAASYISRRKVHSLAINNFHYPPVYIATTLSAYWIFHWTGKHFDVMLKDGSIQISGESHNNNAGNYLVIYQGCTPYTAKRAKELKLSFRKPIAEYGIPAYVIVRIAIPDPLL